MTAPILQASGVTKRYLNKTVVEDVTLAIRPGEAVAFIGHNGSGKTTLLKMLAGLVEPTSGTVRAARSVRFAYVPEHFPKMNLTAAQYIRHMGRIEGLDDKAVKRRAEALFEDFFLADMAHVPIKHLSKGTAQKVGVAQALLTNADVLLLDEPLSGQDMQSQQVFTEKVLARKKAGAAVLLSCHEPHLVRRLADTVYEIRGRRLVETSFVDTPDEVCAALVFAAGDGARGLPALPELGGAREAGGVVRVLIPARLSDAVIVRMIENGYSLKEMHHENNP